MTTELARLIDPLCAAAEQAGATINRYYQEGFAVRTKSDDSPVTDADEAAEAIILPVLKALLPDVPILSEESGLQGRGADLTRARFWAVDPLDGTKEFIRKSDEFTVNIALIENGRPILGVVHAPALDVTYAAAGPGTARMQRLNQVARPITVRAAPADGLIALASRSHDSSADLRDALARYPIKERRRLGSSLKFCCIAAGDADLYIRVGPTCEWDTAAGQAVLEAAGGAVSFMDGAPLTYGKAKFLNPSFIARGDAAITSLGKGTATGATSGAA
jgi:3'(2'), 5'-bisphosphate nucleotidase